MTPVIFPLDLVNLPSFRVCILSCARRGQPQRLGLRTRASVHYRRIFGSNTRFVREIRNPISASVSAPMCEQFGGSGLLRTAEEADKPPTAPKWRHLFALPAWRIEQRRPRYFRTLGRESVG